MIVGDAANFLLNGIPGDLHDMFVKDVEPDDLLRASTTLRDMSTGVRALHVKLSGKVASFDGRWQGDGWDVFESELWQPLSHGLGALERECEYAADRFVTLAAQAAEAYAEKVASLNQEIQTQLWIMGATSVVGSPELGGVIAKAVVGLATRLGGEAAGSIVAGIVRAIEALIEKVVNAFGKALGWAAERTPEAIVAVTGKVARVFPSLPAGGGFQDGSLGKLLATGRGGLDLTIEESRGGHTISRHVGLSDSDLLASNKPTHSSFTDLVTADAATTEAIQENLNGIKSWLAAGSTPTLTLIKSASAYVGRVRLADGSVVSSSSYKVVLRADGRGGAFVLTAFPTA